MVRLYKGDPEVYKVGRGSVQLTPYWDDTEIVEWVLRVTKLAHSKFGGQTITVAAEDFVTWFSLAFPSLSEGA